MLVLKLTDEVKERYFSKRLPAAFVLSLKLEYSLEMKWLVMSRDGYVQHLPSSGSCR